MGWPKGKPFSAEHIAKRSASLRESGARRKKVVFNDGNQQWVCVTCAEAKSANEFYKDNRNLNGLKSDCKQCHCKTVIATRDQKTANKANKFYMRRRRQNNIEKVRAYERQWSAYKRAKRLHATPKWLTREHRKQIAQIYKQCLKGFHVDHIMPLRGKNVWGLHVPWNLQYLTAEANLKKHNKVVEFKTVAGAD